MILEITKLGEAILRQKAEPVAEVNDEILNEAVNELWKNKAKLQTAPFDVDLETLRRIAFFTKNH